MSTEQTLDAADQAVAKVLTSALEAAQNGADFLVGQAPEVITQLLWWEGVSSFLLCGVFLYLTGLFGRISYNGFRDRYEDDANTAACVFGTGASIIFGIVTLCNLAWLKILIAPKIFLIEYAARLVS